MSVALKAVDGAERTALTFAHRKDVGASNERRTSWRPTMDRSLLREREKWGNKDWETATVERTNGQRDRPLIDMRGRTRIIKQRLSHKGTDDWTDGWAGGHDHLYTLRCRRGNGKQRPSLIGVWFLHKVAFQHHPIIL